MKKYIEREIDASVELALEEIPAEWLEEARLYPERLFAFRGKVESDGSVTPLYYFFEFEEEKGIHYKVCIHKKIFPFKYGKEYF